MDFMNREKLLPDKAAIEIKLRKFREDLQAKIDLIQASLDKDVRRAKALDSEHRKRLVSENRSKH